MRILETFAFVLACTLACGPPPANIPQNVDAQAQRFAEAVCEARTTCSCEDNRFESQAACESELFTSFVAKVDDGMAFDSDCLDRLLDSEAMTCAIWPWQEFDRWECVTLSRGLGVGEPCEWDRGLLPAHVSDCAEGLFCHAGACIEGEDITFDIELGEPCKMGIAHPCVDGAYCAVADGICHARGLLDEPCTDFSGCEAGLYCAGVGRNGVGTCTARLELGDVCDPYDKQPCVLGPLRDPWKGCRLSEGEYRCVDENPGICLQTFPQSPS